MSDAPLQIAPHALANLRGLFARSQQVRQEYELALHFTLLGMGLDPADRYQLNIDTGELSPAAKE